MVDNIKVNPAPEGTAVDVATDVVDDVHHPMYKVEFGGDGEATQVSSSNPLPVALPDDPLPVSVPTEATEAELNAANKIENLLKNIATQIKINNLYLQEMSGLTFTENDIEEK